MYYFIEKLRNITQKIVHWLWPDLVPRMIGNMTISHGILRSDGPSRVFSCENEFFVQAAWKGIRWVRNCELDGIYVCSSRFQTNQRWILEVKIFLPRSLVTFTRPIQTFPPVTKESPPGGNSRRWQADPCWDPICGVSFFARPKNLLYIYIYIYMYNYVYIYIYIHTYI